MDWHVCEARARIYKNRFPKRKHTQKKFITALLQYQKLSIFLRIIAVILVAAFKCIIRYNFKLSFKD